MKPFCESMSRYVIPTIRALVARDLIEVHKLNQKEAAKKLGMTQPAVSQYKKHTRGDKARKLEEDKKINKMVSEMSNSLAKNEIDFQEAASEICNICKYIRRRKLTKEMF